MRQWIHACDSAAVLLRTRKSPAARAGRGSTAIDGQRKTACPGNDVPNRALVADHAASLSRSRQVPHQAASPAGTSGAAPSRTALAAKRTCPTPGTPTPARTSIWTAHVGGMSSPGRLERQALHLDPRRRSADRRRRTIRRSPPAPRRRKPSSASTSTPARSSGSTSKNMTQTEVPFHRLGWSSPCVDPSDRPRVRAGLAVLAALPRRRHRQGRSGSGR